MNAAAAEVHALDRTTARTIARAFLPPRWHGNRWDYYYARIKLGHDPLYPGVADALRGSDAPLLDLGCGLGLLAHSLRAEGIALPYFGVDNDAAKIIRARRAMASAALPDVRFDVVDLAQTLPRHRGSVAILDVLQYLADDAQQRLLDAAIAMLIPGARLVIRTGLDDGSPRARLTRDFDRLAHALRWMHSPPRRYPQAGTLRARLAAAGLAVRLDEWRGRTPFNNWRIVATKP